MLGCTLLHSKSAFHPFPSKVKPSPPTFRVTAAAAASTAVQTESSQNTLYQVLRINHTASQAGIKAAYRSLAKQYHPDAAAASSASFSSSDTNGTDFIQIHDAYATLSDPEARATYDLSIGATAAHCHCGCSASNISRFNPTRRWETDQCW